jgi:hypothetical protein
MLNNLVQLFSVVFSYNLPIVGIASGLDHIWTDLVDHQKPELSASFLVIYDKCNLTSQMRSRFPACAIIIHQIYYLGYDSLFKLFILLKF